MKETNVGFVERRPARRCLIPKLRRPGSAAESGRTRPWHESAWFATALLALACAVNAAEVDPQHAWPAVTRESRPWAYWWWMASAVDRTNLTRELERYQQAGMGGVHIIPIYGAKDFEASYIEYLSPRWMEMLDHTVAEANRLGLGVDMTTGTGWCFGGPQVTDQEANATVVGRSFDLAAGQKLPDKLDPGALQALVAFNSDGKSEDIMGRIAVDGSADWSPAAGTWKIYAVSQKPSGQKVKRAAPGGQGHMLNLIYPQAVAHYLTRFEEAFATYTGAKPRAMYHDSYEYRSDWAPDFFAQFEKRRGYRLQTELPAIFSAARAPGTSPALPAPGAEEAEHVARVKSDYRETISDIMIEESLPLWTEWSRRHGFLTRNEAHGSPANWLDLYALADIPETEMFHTDRSRLISKFASSAAHLAGRKLVAAETGTWLAEHFTETLADMKYLVDDLFLSGVNHVIYHGTCYSPDQAPWPGWLFYASYEMNPRNSVWRDVSALNAYVARCQSVLQSGRPDNDLLLYWPIFDAWHNPTGMARNLTVHARDWFEDQPVGKTASRLWHRGYAFDYASDRQVLSAVADSGSVRMAGGNYRAIVVPPTEHMPLSTLRRLLVLAEAGATVVFEGHLPQDVPGWGQLTGRRTEFRALLNGLKLEAGPKSEVAKLGRGRVLVGDLESALADAGVIRETMFDQIGLMCLRRVLDGGWFYFIANRSDQPVIGWMPLARLAHSAAIMDPLTGASGAARLRRDPAEKPQVFLHLMPGESMILKCTAAGEIAATQWRYWAAAGPALEITGTWHGRFLQGGPELPGPFQMSRLASWATLPDPQAQRFAGTALYRVTFDAPRSPQHWWLDLGKVCQSARVRVNGRDLGTLYTAPFRVLLTGLKSSGNVLEVEVTNVAANRIRDLDRQGVSWRNFHDINFVGIDYKPFDASRWQLADSGLLGPVTLTPVSEAKP